ncbi:MAG: 2-amino-4-hydroxy-6-hydroxymethyldihydropteridine diphosphokinase [Acidobacteria bacterium RIFCSPHIGHO2_01_FULL_67_28]|nr:MAG: 2-amino-4-hydroxy-6-hydroxymethyldihydropteridine diphosphokinase [Acidobacteria bacterium RIFCSPHIGHO2_01_FULL_67_28]
MADSLKTAYLALGSNLGDRAALIEQAMALLEQAGVRVRRRSALYETEPVGMSPGRWFLNCVLEIETERMPLGLLHLLKRIERQLGRRPVSGRQPEARRIDIDILIYGEQVVRAPELTLPHPRLHERRFVLEPLRELAPDWRHPVTRQTAGEMLSTLADGGAVRRYSPS